MPSYTDKAGRTHRYAVVEAPVEPVTMQKVQLYSVRILVEHYADVTAVDAAHAEQIVQTFIENDHLDFTLHSAPVAAAYKLRTQKAAIAAIDVARAAGDANDVIASLDTLAEIADVDEVASPPFEVTGAYWPTGYAPASSPPEGAQLVWPIEFDQIG